MNITDEYIKKLPNTENLVKELEERLIKMYGVLISSNDLWKILCFKTPYAYRQARYRKLLSITEFEMHGRKGRFALTSEVAAYIAKQRLETENNLIK